MPVFISHKQEDIIAAKKINDYLNINGIKTYLDVLDPALPVQLVISLN